ncbi:hypothetical protein ACVWZW_004445 [Bradyrhizobium sp. F1.13.4]
MIDTVKSDPELMRRTVYDLARHKLQEQLGSSGPAEMKQAELALEAAIRGVEQFSQEQIFPAPSMAPQFEAPMAVPYSPRTTPPFAARLGFKSVAEQRHRLFWTTAKRTAVVSVGRFIDCCGGLSTRAPWLAWTGGSELWKIHVAAGT